MKDVTPFPVAGTQTDAPGMKIALYYTSLMDMPKDIILNFKMRDLV